MVTAMETKKASKNKGSMPRAVVEAAIATGRNLLVPEARMASIGPAPEAS